MNRLSEFLQEANGQFSSARLFALLVVFGYIVDWMHTIWILQQKWDPAPTSIGMVAGVLGFKVWQKFGEEKPGVQP